MYWVPFPKIFNKIQASFHVIYFVKPSIIENGKNILFCCVKLKNKIIIKIFLKIVLKRADFRILRLLLKVKTAFTFKQQFLTQERYLVGLKAYTHFFQRHSVLKHNFNLCTRIPGGQGSP